MSNVVEDVPLQEPPAVRRARIEREHRQALEKLEHTWRQHRAHNDKVELEQRQGRRR